MLICFKMDSLLRQVMYLYKDIFRKCLVCPGPSVTFILIFTRVKTELLKTTQMIALLGLRRKMYFVIAKEIFYAFFGLNKILS